MAVRSGFLFQFKYSVTKMHQAILRGIRIKIALKGFSIINMILELRKTDNRVF